MNNIIIILNSMDNMRNLCFPFYQEFSKCMEINCYNCPLCKWGARASINDLADIQKFNNIYGD